MGVGREEKESRLGKVQESSQIGQLEVRFGDGTSEQVANGIHRLGKRRIFHCPCISLEGVCFVGIRIECVTLNKYITLTIFFLLPLFRYGGISTAHN